jgi:hypothetical protein
MVLVGKPEGKRPLGRLRHRCEDGFRMDFREIGRGGGVEVFLSSLTFYLKTKHNPAFKTL